MLVPAISGEAGAAHHLRTNPAACSHPQRSRGMKGNDQKGRSDRSSSGSHKIFPLVGQRLMSTSSCGAESRGDGESQANARAKQREGEEMPRPEALLCVTPMHRDPFNPRAPQQAAILRDGEDCNLVCEQIRTYKYASHQHGCKNSACTGILYGTSAAQTSPALTPTQMGHEGPETQGIALRPLTSRSRQDLAQIRSSPSGAVHWELTSPGRGVG